MSSTGSVSSQFLGQLLLPLQSMVNFFSPPVPARAPVCARVSKRLNQDSSQAEQPSLTTGTPLVSKELLGQSPKPQAPQVLRSRRAQDGRIVISGRMRDVCAELDRLCDDRA